MANAKIEFKIGKVAFSGEGEEKWVAAQLEKVMDNLQALTRPSKAADQDGDEDDDEEPSASSSKSESAVGTLASFLQKHQATTNQVQRFLATAEWLHQKGTARPRASDVAKALKDNHQSRLGNPSDCLNKCVKKGHCEKDGKGFFVTPEGKASLGK